jgi:chromosome segregation ATPase
MFHLQSLELLHWDYCQRLTLPLDGAIITVAGPNGSGKTTLLDAMRTLLGLECSGGRSYKTYARHAKADTAWLRATVDNQPRNRQAASRPFARNLLYSDQVTLVCRIERNGGDWQRRYAMVEGDVSIEELTQKPEKEWLGIEHWRKRLEGAGLSRAIARVLALEQGQTDRLCEYSPKELLRLVFDVFGDQEVLDRYEEARQHQRQLSEEVEAAQRELAHGQAQLAQLEARANLYRQHQAKLREREQLATEVIPVLAWAEERQELAGKLRELHRQRLHQAGEARQRADYKRRLLESLQAQQQAEQQVGLLKTQRDEAQAMLDEARAAEKPVEQLLKQADELGELAAVEGDAAQLAQRLAELEAAKAGLSAEWQQAKTDRAKAQAALDALVGERLAPPPPEVQRFLRVLRGEGIAHHVLADVIEITDEHWRAAAEGVLRGARWVVVLDQAADEARALALAERERYRHYLVAEAEAAPKNPDPHSLLAVLRFSAPAPAWLLRQLAQIRRVDNTAAGVKTTGEWITPEAYWRDARGGRSVWVDPSQHQFGAAALTARRASIEARLAQLDAQLTQIAQRQTDTQRQLDAARQASQGHRAAEELARRGEEFARAREQLPALKQARVQAAQRWQNLDMQHATALREQMSAQTRYNNLQDRLSESERQAEKYEREWRERYETLRERAAGSRSARARFPARWIATEALAELRQRYINATQARLRLDGIEKASGKPTPRWKTRWC